MLAISRALMGRPKLPLLDEPSLGLAPQVIEKIVEILRDVNSRGVSILLVEQNAHMALGISDYAYVLETGRVTLGDRSAALRQRGEGRRADWGQ